MSRKVKVSPAALLAANLRARARLGLWAISGPVQAKLKQRLNPPLLAVETPQPLSDRCAKLWEAMLAVVGLKPEAVGMGAGPAKVRLRLLMEEEEGETGRLCCWHPQALLQNPDLKKHAYQQLKALRAEIKALS